MKSTTILAAIAAISLATASCQSSSSDSEKAKADSIARADSIAEVFEKGDALVADFTALAAKIDTLDAKADWEDIASQVGEAIYTRDVCDGKGVMSDRAFQEFNELLGKVNAKVETLPKAQQDKYFNVINPLLEKANAAGATKVTEEIIKPQ
ncbi:MAG: hypothetical protein J6Y87_02920 [Muribaculaceae bacterium]|nr:hypothetical protein [Muribaculaceae bacterium]